MPKNSFIFCSWFISNNRPPFRLSKYDLKDWTSPRVVFSQRFYCVWFIFSCWVDDIFSSFLWKQYVGFHLNCFSTTVLCSSWKQYVGFHLRQFSKVILNKNSQQLFLGVLNTTFSDIPNHATHLELKISSVQIVIITSFIVILNVDIKRVDSRKISLFFLLMWCYSSNIYVLNIKESMKYLKDYELLKHNTLYQKLSFWHILYIFYFEISIVY